MWLIVQKNENFFCGSKNQIASLSFHWRCPNNHVSRAHLRPRVTAIVVWPKIRKQTAMINILNLYIFFSELDVFLSYSNIHKKVPYSHQRGAISSNISNKKSCPKYFVLLHQNHTNVVFNHVHYSNQYLRRQPESSLITFTGSDSMSTSSSRFTATAITDKRKKIWW